MRLRILVLLGCGEKKCIQNFGGKSSLKGYWKTEEMAELHYYESFRNKMEGGRLMYLIRDLVLTVLNLWVLLPQFI